MTGDEPAGVGGVRPLPRRSLLADDTYAYLRDAMLGNRIPPGGRVNIEQLSRDLGVSITPIRHALVRLEADGLVVSEPYKGYVASPLLDSATVSEIYQARVIIETEVTRLAAGVVQADELAELRGLADADPFEARAVVGDEAPVNCDDLLHRRIARIGGNKIIEQMLAGLHQRLAAYRSFQLQQRKPAGWDPSQNLAVTQAEHRDVVDALAAGDAASAAEAMRTHLGNASRRDIDSWVAHP